MRRPAVLTLAVTMALAFGPVDARAPERSPIPELRPATGAVVAQAGVTVAATLTVVTPDRARQPAPARPAPAMAAAPPVGHGVDTTEAVAQAAVAAVAEDLAVLRLARRSGGAGGAGQDTPSPSQDAVGELVLAGLGRAQVSPAAAAPVRSVQPDTTRPTARPTGHPASATVVRASASTAGAPVSRLAVARSPAPPRRSETARRRYLDSLRPAAAVRTQPVAPAITGQPSGNLCGVRGIEGQTIAPIAGRIQGCGVAQPVRVTVVDGLRLSQAATIDCDTARALHRWVREGVKPAIGRTGGGPIELRVAAHYACRTMNHRRGAPVSEHGRGRAIDISGIRLANGTMLTVLRDWRHASYGPMLRQMHRAACGIFSTTLGPGSDGMHEDHFHYDTAQRRSRPICR